MTISFPVTPPSTPKPSRVEWSQRVVTSVSQSPFTLQTQTQEWSGDGWIVDVSFDPLTRVEAAPWIAFLASLRGPKGTFYFGDTLLATAQGTPTGTPLVNGASQVGFTLNTDGWTAGVAAFKAGDLFQIDNSLYLVTADATADGSGELTIDIWPSLRGHSDNAALTVSSPKCVMRLVSTTVQAVSAPQTQLYDINFTAEEAR